MSRCVSAGRERIDSEWLKWLIVSFTLGFGLMSIQSSAADALESDQGIIRFSQSASYATEAEVKRRFGFKDSTSQYDIAKESFLVIAPGSYTTNSIWGLMVWISPSDEVQIPLDWQSELQRHGFLLIGARNSGNNRAVIDRARLALDATSNMCRQFKIDRRRIYIAGFSGGARMASMLGVAWPDVFRGTFSVCGVNFYRNVKTTTGRLYVAAYTPDPRYLSMAKKSGRFVLLTGENDMNRENTKTVMKEGFLKDGFNQVLCLELPGMKHAMPGAVEFNRALDYLDAGKSSRSLLEDR